MVRTWGVLHLLTWKCASRHNCVQFFIAPVASWLRTRRFSEPTFRPSWATNHWKNTVFRDFPTFSRICIFCPLTLSLLLFSLLIFLFSLPLPYSAFHLSILSEVWLLNFLRSIIQANCIFDQGIYYTDLYCTIDNWNFRFVSWCIIFSCIIICGINLLEIVWCFLTYPPVSSNMALENPPFFSRILPWKTLHLSFFSCWMGFHPPFCFPNPPLFRRFSGWNQGEPLMKSQ